MADDAPLTDDDLNYEEFPEEDDAGGSDASGEGDQPAAGAAAVPEAIRVLSPELAALLTSQAEKTAQILSKQTVLEKKNRSQERQIERLTAELAEAKAARPTNSKPYVPASGDNDYYPPGRAGVNDPCRPRLLVLENERVFRSLAGDDPRKPSGRALDWATIVAVCTYLADFVAYWSEKIAPALSSLEGGEEIRERSENTLGGIFAIVEGRYDYIFASSVYSHAPGIATDLFENIYGEFLTGRIREGSELARTLEDYRLHRSQALVKAAAKADADKDLCGSLSGKASEKRKKDSKPQNNAKSAKAGAKATQAD